MSEEGRMSKRTRSKRGKTLPITDSGETVETEHTTDTEMENVQEQEIHVSGVTAFGESREASPQRPSSTDLQLAEILRLMREQSETNQQQLQVMTENTQQQLQTLKSEIAENNQQQFQVLTESTQQQLQVLTENNQRQAEATQQQLQGLKDQLSRNTERMESQIQNLEAGMASLRLDIQTEVGYQTSAIRLDVNNEMAKVYEELERIKSNYTTRQDFKSVEMEVRRLNIRLTEQQEQGDRKWQELNSRLPISGDAEAHRVIKEMKEKLSTLEKTQEESRTALQRIQVEGVVGIYQEEITKLRLDIAKLEKEMEQISMQTEAGAAISNLRQLWEWDNMDLGINPAPNHPPITTGRGAIPKRMTTQEENQNDSSSVEEVDVQKNKEHPEISINPPMSQAFSSVLGGNRNKDPYLQSGVAPRGPSFGTTKYFPSQARQEQLPKKPEEPSTGRGQFPWMPGISGQPPPMMPMYVNPTFPNMGFAQSQNVTNNVHPALGRLNIPNFSGDGQGLIFPMWWNEVSNLFQQLNVPEASRLAYLRQALKGNALQLIAARSQPVQSSDELGIILREHFWSVPLQTYIMSEVLQTPYSASKHRTPLDYVRGVLKFAKWFTLGIPETVVVNGIVNMMPPEIQTTCRLYGVQTYNHLEYLMAQLNPDVVTMGGTLLGTKRARPSDERKFIKATTEEMVHGSNDQQGQSSGNMEPKKKIYRDNYNYKGNCNQGYNSNPRGNWRNGDNRQKGYWNSNYQGNKNNNQGYAKKPYFRQSGQQTNGGNGKQQKPQSMNQTPNQIKEKSKASHQNNQEVKGQNDASNKEKGKQDVKTSNENPLLQEMYKTLNQLSKQLSTLQTPETASTNTNQ